MVWFLRPDLHQELLVISIWTLPFGVISAWWFLQDYWRPEYILPFRLEDWLFGFLVGGVAATWGTTLTRMVYTQPPARFAWARAALVIGWGMSVVLTVDNLLGFNSIYASIADFVTTSLVVIYCQRNLIAPAMIGGITLVPLWIIMTNIACYVFPGFIDRWWLMAGTQLDIRVFNAPWTELIWAFSFGALASICYPFCTNTSRGLQTQWFKTRSKSTLSELPRL